MRGNLVLALCAVFLCSGPGVWAVEPEVELELELETQVSISNIVLDRQDTGEKLECADGRVQVVHSFEVIADVEVSAESEARATVSVDGEEIDSWYDDREETDSASASDSASEIFQFVAAWASASSLPAKGFRLDKSSCRLVGTDGKPLDLERSMALVRLIDAERRMEALGADLRGKRPTAVPKKLKLKKPASFN